MSILQRKFH